MFSKSKLIIKNSNSFLYNKLSKKAFSFENIIKMKNRDKAREIQLSLYGKEYAIFIKPDEKLFDLKNKIEKADEKIQKVEILNLETKEKLNLDTQFKDVEHIPIKFEINGYINQNYLPSHITCFNDFSIKNIYSKLLQMKINDSKGSFDNSKNEILNKLENLLKIYNSILLEYKKAETLIHKRLLQKQKLYLNLSIAFFLLHLIVFYLLIFQFYGWDQIEPVTYIVGNVYWIIGLGFLLRYRAKLDISYFYSKTFNKRFLKQRAELFGYNKVDKEFIANEIVKMNSLKKNLDLI